MSAPLHGNKLKITLPKEDFLSEKIFLNILKALCQFLYLEYQFIILNGYLKLKIYVNIA